MCGITGMVRLDEPLPPGLCGALPAMTFALSHRGPDGEGHYCDRHAALGHRRLSIIDRAGGQQPLSNEDGTCWVVFNGEIYNYRALREELRQRGHTFRTQSDTEVIVHAYEQFAERCVERLEGMFAFAVYDQRRRELFLARDRVGKKPLFYARFDGVWHFASETAALRHSPLWDGAVDPDAIETYLLLGYIPAPDTIYRHISKLPAAHWMRVTATGSVVRRYWDIEEFETDNRPLNVVADEVTDHLRRAVTDRLESEVPLGAFLSGGIDSGLVVSCMAEAMPQKAITVSVGFEGAEHNELDAAALTAARYQTIHHPSVERPELSLLIDTVLTRFDEPFADASAVPTWLVSQAARRHVTVVLSGDGGDETFAGYSFRYVPHVIEQSIRRLLPSPLRASLGALGSMWPRRVPRILRLGSTLRNLGTDAAGAYFRDLCFAKPEAVRRLLGTRGRGRVSDIRCHAAVTDTYNRPRGASPLTRAQYADLRIYLSDDVLAKVDRMSMQHALEVRCPLLDRALIETAFRLGARTRLRHWESKAVLRRVARDRLPPELLRMPKHGFTAPVSAWLSGPYRRLLQQDLCGSDACVRRVIDREQLRTLICEHTTGTADHAYLLWATWMLERWWRAQAAPRNVIRTQREVAVHA